MTIDGGGGPGTRLGITDQDPGEGAIEVEAVDGHWAGELQSRAFWGDWQDWGHGTWGELQSPSIVASGQYVWIVANGRSDWAQPGHTHWDDLVVESTTPAPPPPTGEDYTIVVYDGNGNEVTRTSFPVTGGVDKARINSLATEIKALTE
jgi:hypothetical protein